MHADPVTCRMYGHRQGGESLLAEIHGKDPWAMVCPPPRDENPPFLPIMKNRRKQFNRTLCLMVA
ncbi:hypothetical protein CV944_16730 [Geobacillus sp. WSUCF-018B]|nr:hypothetical protein CV944_16730 [Geobacillus sp. WSUCF-018B]